MPSEHEKECPDGGLNPKQSCDCSNAPGWNENGWQGPWCHRQTCFSGQRNYPNCTGKADLRFADGTWCNERNGIIWRDTKCSAVEGKMQ